jgi:hypothetical protein
VPHLRQHTTCCTASQQQVSIMVIAQLRADVGPTADVASQAGEPLLRLRLPASTRFSIHGDRTSQVV